MNFKQIRTRDRQTDRQTETETDRDRQTEKQTDIDRERETDRKTKLSVTPRHHTVQEGLSMVSCRESITKSKHVLC